MSLIIQNEKLDPLHLSTPVLGDEQVFDVELDRNTLFLPIREDQRVVSWDVTYDDTSPSVLGGVGSVVGVGGLSSIGRKETSGESQDRVLSKTLGIPVKEGDDVGDDLTRGGF